MHAQEIYLGRNPDSVRGIGSGFRSGSAARRPTAYALGKLIRTKRLPIVYIIQPISVRTALATLHIGFDDTDSRLGHCTTRLAFRLVQTLLSRKARFADYPNLVRLNPNIPWKTRGNGAVCLRASVHDVQDIIEIVSDCVKAESAIGSGANPGLVFYEGENISEAVRQFSVNAMHDVLSRQMAEKIAAQTGVRCITFGNGQGIVGALAAIGSCLTERDHTFELIGYRRPENCGRPRVLDKDKIVRFSNQTYPETFNSYDAINDRILVAPHGPDPVFVGVRGESPQAVSLAIHALDPPEELEGWAIFRTNQGTNMHLEHELSLSAIKAYTAGFIRCTVKSNPIVGLGGHVFFSVEQSGSEMQAAVYEPTGLFHIAYSLRPGDFIEIGCGVRKGTTKHPKILNVEYLRILEVASIFDLANPKCPRCLKRMKSEGKEKGFQCAKCKYRDSKSKKILEPHQRELKPGLYLPNATAHRHLTKPLHRYGREKRYKWEILPLEKFLFVD